MADVSLLLDSNCFPTPDDLCLVCVVFLFRCHLGHRQHEDFRLIPEARCLPLSESEKSEMLT